MNTDTSKVALVTGASRGIGAAIAQRLAADGFTVIINYAGGAADAEALAGKIEKAGGRAITAQADVSDPVAVARMFDAADAAFGGVDVLVNNAGIMPLSSTAEGAGGFSARRGGTTLKGGLNPLGEGAKGLGDGG